MKLLYDARTDCIVYDHVDPLKIAAAVPEARRLHNGYVALPASLTNLQALTRAGLPVPSPLRAYDWPTRHGQKPMAIQKETAAFLALNKRAFVLSEMRTGKTRSSLWAADYVMRQHAPGACRALIVANLSTLRRTWGKEIFENFMGRRTYVVVHGADQKARLRALSQDADFYIVNHDGVGVGAVQTGRGAIELRGFADALAKRHDIKIVIIDEASAYREASTRRHRVARQVFGQVDYLWQMTGTPTPNRPTDAYGMAKLANNAWGESFKSFQGRTMLQVSPFKWVPRAGAHAIVQTMLSPAIRFTQEDCFDAPPVMIEDRDCELSAEQKKLLAELKREAAVTLKSGTKLDIANEAALRTKLIQIACGAVYDSTHASHKVDAKPRMTILREVVSEAPRKVIIFAPLTNAINAIHDELKGDFSCAVVDGNVSEKVRSQILNDFQSSSHPRILIAHPGPIARGLDLTAAATIVWYAPTDKTEDYIQANQRINGPAQKHSRTIVQIAATPTEREIFRRLANNETLQGVMLKLVEER